LDNHIIDVRCLQGKEKGQTASKGIRTDDTTPSSEPELRRRQFITRAEIVQAPSPTEKILSGRVYALRSDYDALVHPVSFDKLR
jgi:hypothetical protein